MQDYYRAERDRVAAFNAECSAAGRECLTPREAARLFGVGESTIREAARQGRIEPVFTLRLAKDTPMYKLSDLADYFAGRNVVDPELLAQMRENGCGMGTSFGGGWLILTLEPAVSMMTPTGRRHVDAEARPYWDGVTD